MLTLQQLQLQEPKWFKLITITFEDAVKQTFRENLLVISHRWEFHDDEGKEADHPDMDGEQFKYIVRFLNSPEGANIEYVWIDYCCIAQNPPLGVWPEGYEVKRDENHKIIRQEFRSEGEKQEFGFMLKNANLLYIGLKVLILWDYMYSNRCAADAISHLKDSHSYDDAFDLFAPHRFWTLYESYLSMQWPSPSGLQPAVLKVDVDAKGEKVWEPEDSRWNVIDVTESTGSRMGKNMLEQNWLVNHTGVEATMERLQKKDVAVTNQSDKEKLIPRLKDFDSLVKKKAESLGLAELMHSAIMEGFGESDVKKEAVKRAQAAGKKMENAAKGGQTAQMSLNKEEQRKAKLVKEREAASNASRASARLKKMMEDEKHVKKQLDDSKKREEKLQSEVERLKKAILELGGNPEEAEQRQITMRAPTHPRGRSSERGPSSRAASGERKPSMVRSGMNKVSRSMKTMFGSQNKAPSRPLTPSRNRVAPGT